MKVLFVFVLFYIFSCVYGSALYTACHADRVKFCPSIPPPYTEETLFESKCFQLHKDLLSTPCRQMMDNYLSLKSTPTDYSVAPGGYGESVQTEIGSYPASYPVSYPQDFNLSNSGYIVDAVYAPQSELEMQIQSICFADFQKYCPAEIPFYINYNDHSCIKENLAHFSHRCHGIISSWLSGNSVYIMKYISLFLIPLSLFLCLTCVAGCCARLRRKRFNCRSRYQCRGRRNNNNTTNTEDLTEEELAFVFGDVPMQSETIVVPQYEQQNPSAPPQQGAPQQVVYLFPFQNTENPSGPIAFASPQFQFQPEVIFPTTNANTNK